MEAPVINPTKYGNEVALNSKSAPGQGEQYTLRMQGTHRLTSSRQLPAPRDILSVLWARQKQRRLTGCCLENEKRPSASIRQWRNQQEQIHE